MQRKRLWLLAGVLALAGGTLYLLLSTLTAHAVITSTVHTTVDDFTPGKFYLTGMTQQNDGEVALLRIGIAGEWIAANVQGLPPMYGHAMVEHDGYIYVLGGKLTGGAPTRAVYMSRINTTTHMLDPFTTTTPLPSTAYPNGVYMHSAVVVSDHLYIIGGDIDSFNVPTSTVMYATFGADGTLSQWQFAPSLPDLRSRVPAVALNGYIYVPGGKNDTGGGSAATGSVLYAPMNSSGLITGWFTATADLPYSPLGQMAATFNGRLYVMGGFDSNSYGVQPYVYFATPSTTTGNIEAGGWISTTPMQRPIMGGVALAFNGELFGLGGIETFFGNPVGYARSALLDIESGHVITFAEGEAWYLSPALVPDRVWHAAATSPDHQYVYVLGGTSGAFADPLANGILNRGSTTGQSGGSGYARSGWYIGPTIELGREHKVLGFNWTTGIPSTAVTLTMQYRTQGLTGAWSDWSAPIPPSGTIGLLTTTVPFTDARAFRFQYQALLTTTAPLSYTPYLHRFELVYDVPLPPQFIKQASPPPGQAVLQGQRITYTLTFTNPNDLSPLRNVIIADTLSPYLTYVPGSITATQGIIPDDSHLPELRWIIIELPTQASGQASFVAIVSNTAPIGAWLNNQAIFRSSDTDDMPSWTSHPIVELQLPILIKTALPASGTPVLAGQALTYTLTYSNPNHGLTLNAVITDILPANTIFSGWCEPICTVEGDELRWSFTLPPLTQGQAQFSVAINPTAISGTVIANTSYATGCVTEAGVCTNSISSNSTEHYVVNILPPEISKQANPPGGSSAAQPAPVSRGTLLTYTLVYKNPDPFVPLTATMIHDQVPTNTTFVSCTGGCFHNSNVVSWTLGFIAPAAEGQVQFTVQVTSTLEGAMIQNRATLDSNRSSADSNTVYHRALTPYDLRLTLTNRVITTLPGATFTYTLNYTNSGPWLLSGIVITDYLGFTPQGEASAPAMPYMTVLRSSPGWQLVQAGTNGNIYQYNVGTLGPNTTGALTMVVRLNNTIPYTVNLASNRAVITDDGTKGYDSNPLNQSPSVDNPIQGPDLVVSNPRVPMLVELGRPFAVSVTITNRGLDSAFDWEHWITPSHSSGFVVELYVKPSNSAQSKPPTGPHDHAGGYCSIGANPCDERPSYVYLINLTNALAAGSSVAASWSVPVAAHGTYSLYIQVDTGYWWQNDPVYGRVLEYNERNNIVAAGSATTIRNKVYLPSVMRH